MSLCYLPSLTDGGTLIIVNTSSIIRERSIESCKSQSESLMSLKIRKGVIQGEQELIRLKGDRVKWRVLAFSSSVSEVVRALNLEQLIL